MSDPHLPQDFRAALVESAWLLRQNRPDEALHLLRPLHVQRPDDVDVAINLGGAYILKRQWDRAVKALRPAADRHPNHAMLWSNLGAAYLGRLELAGPQQQARAIAAYERALEADPKAPNVHYHLGLIYKERGELDRARAMFEQALEVDPADLDAASWLRWLAQAADIHADGGEASDGLGDPEQPTAALD